MSISSKYHCDLSDSQVLAGEQVLLSVHFLASGLISLARIIYIGFWTAFTGEAALAISVTKYVDLSCYLFSPWFPLAESCSQWELLDNREIKGVTHSPFHPLFFFLWQNYLEPPVLKSPLSSNPGDSGGDWASLDLPPCFQDPESGVFLHRSMDHKGINHQKEGTELKRRENEFNR